MSAARPTALVTGATGFVGRQVLRQLVRRGVDVRAVVRAGTQGRLEALPGTTVTMVSTPDLFAEPAAWWQQACDGVDVVVHVAWTAEPGRYLTSPVNLDCLQGTLALARGAAQAGVRRFVGVGTCFEYDVRAGRLSTSTPLLPSTPYAAAKAAAYLALAQWLPTQQVGFAWCRLFYLHGEGEDPRRLVASLRAKLAAGEPVELTSGAQVRDFLDVAEAGARIVDVALGDEVGAVNVCSGTGVTVRALAEQIADEVAARCGTERRSLLRFGARPENLVDPPVVVGVRE